MLEELYYCVDCDRLLPKTEKKKAPECCGKKMELKPKDQCVKGPSDPEHARFGDDDEPCDDGR